MTEKVNMYTKGKIYKIVNDVNDDIYIGSTVKQLSNRMAGHRSHSKILDNAKVYEFMRLIGVEHFDIILLESFPCNSKEELRAREHYYISTLKPVLNTNDSIDDVEKRIKNHRASSKLYAETHKSDISIKNIVYYEQNKQVICEKVKKYRDANKAKINASQKKLIKCDACNIDILKHHSSRHNKTKKHINNVQKLNF
jgi:group I intron endonuclease